MVVQGMLAALAFPYGKLPPVFCCQQHIQKQSFIIFRISVVIGSPLTTSSLTCNMLHTDRQGMSFLPHSDRQAFRSASFDKLLSLQRSAKVQYARCCFSRWRRRTLGVRAQRRHQLCLQCVTLWRALTTGAKALSCTANRLSLFQCRQHSQFAAS